MAVAIGGWVVGGPAGSPVWVASGGSRMVGGYGYVGRLVQAGGVGGMISGMGDG